jgi:hypothetical protein
MARLAAPLGPPPIGIHPRGSAFADGRPPKERMRRIAEAWRPCRTVACFREPKVSFGTGQAEVRREDALA